MSEDPQPESGEPAQQPEFRLTGPWIVVGVLAVVVGILCGLIMSTATFFR